MDGTGYEVDVGAGGYKEESLAALE